ncbi:hypothetical protein NDU88_007400 [Pleurodeles waltl]|uniref:Uncharacterized protein n=1 Tax=Pleurodeles waltl TaxID=8319 RepID=A0AAV7NBD5_PLEWA|nr:hypothetical protein NDU88_007400 [Pleurodeles waltl]
MPLSRGCIHFLFICKLGILECGTANQFVELAKELGIPLAGEKAEGPATRLFFLETELDTMEGVCRLPQTNVDELKQTIELLLTRKKATLGEVIQRAGTIPRYKQKACSRTSVEPNGLDLTILVDNGEQNGKDIS